MDDAQNPTAASGKRCLAWALLLLTLVLVAYSAYFYWHLSDETPESSNWSSAAAAIKISKEKDDLVALVPFWATRGEEAFAKASLPYRYVRDVSKEEWPGAKRLWVVSSYDRFGDRQAFLDQGARSLRQMEFGAVRVELFSLPRDLSAAYLFRAHLPEMEVWLDKGGQRLNCEPYDAANKRHVCVKGEDWMRVNELTTFLGDSPRRAIWAHPRTGAPLHIKLGNVAARQELVVQTGFLVAAQTLPEGAPVFVDVWVDGRLLGRVTQENRDGWFTRRFPLGASQADSHAVELVISTPNDGRRHFAFDAFAY